MLRLLRTSSIFTKKSNENLQTDIIKAQRRVAYG